MGSCFNYVLVFLLLTSAPLAFAKKNNKVQAELEEVQTTAKNWSLGLYSEVHGGINKSPEGEAAPLGSMTEFLVGQELSADLLFKKAISVEKELNGERKTRVLYGYFGMRNHFHPAFLSSYNENIKLEGEARAYLPYNRDDFRDGFVSRAWFSNKTKYNLKAIGIKNSGMQWQILGYRNFYRYKQGVDGVPNTMYSLSNKLSLSYSPRELIDLSVSFMNSNYWSFLGNRTPDKFEIGTEVAYNVTPPLTLALGFGTGGQTFKDNGVESNIRIYDEYSSTYYISLFYNF